jgi:hypothetical protein
MLILDKQESSKNKIQRHTRKCRSDSFVVKKYLLHEDINAVTVSVRIQACQIYCEG